jgi:hypothetical protein
MRSTMSAPIAAAIGHTHFGRGRPIIPLHLNLPFWGEDLVPVENVGRRELCPRSSRTVASSVAVLVGSTGTRNIINSTPQGHIALLPYQGRSQFKFLLQSLSELRTSRHVTHSYINRQKFSYCPDFQNLEAEQGRFAGIGLRFGGISTIDGGDHDSSDRNNC